MSEKQVASRTHKSRREWLRSRLDSSALPRFLHASSRNRSRQSNHTPSPAPNKGETDSVRASSSIPEIRPAVKLDDKLNGKPDDKSDDNQKVESDDEENAKLRATIDISQGQKNGNNPETNKGVTDLAQGSDMWKNAEAQLRRDEKKGRLLDAYYDILKFKLKDLKPAGTTERQKQISTFIVSEYGSFDDTKKLGGFAEILKSAANRILKAERVISAAAQPCLPASIACAGVMLVLSVSSSLRPYILQMLMPR